MAISCRGAAARRLLGAVVLSATVAGVGLATWHGPAAQAEEADGEARVTALGSSFANDVMASANTDAGQGGWLYDPDDPLAPKITFLADGTAIQRTPSENLPASPDSTSPTYHPEENVPYNTYYLNADAKGCNSCHADLAETVASMPYNHLSLSTEATNIELTVQMCMDCHDPDGNGAMEVSKDFGTTIHNVHAKNGVTDCQSCHDMTEDGQGTQLWDVVKHERMHAMTDIAADDMDGDFSWRQDETLPAEKTFDFNWNLDSYDYTRMHHVENNDPLDEKLFDSWTISMTGLDGTSKTWTLPDLISEATAAGAVETRPLKLQCAVNATGGPAISQLECTGVSLSWMAEQVGGLDGVQSFQVGDTGSYVGMLDARHLESDEAFLVFEEDGQKLTWDQGYPCMVISGSVAAAENVKQPCDIVLSSDTAEEYAGWYEQGAWRYNKPNVGLFDVREGQIIKTGETFTFHGYADAFDEPVTAIELSMDRGKTWKRYELDDANTTQWVTWTYDFTPQTDGAYTIYVRCEIPDGSYTEEPIEKMVVAKAEIPEEAN